MMPIVAIGASAGGLKQISALLNEIPSATGAAFVVLQHLDPAHSSQLTELLGRASALSVVTIEDGMAAEADRVHVIPPGHSLGIEGNLFRLTRNEGHASVPTLIDRFFQALAAEQAHEAIGVVLSGSGRDGALGLKSIEAHGGLTLAQDPETAEHDGMPRAAVTTSSIDFVGDTPQLVAALLNHLRLKIRPSHEHDTTPHASGDPFDDGALDTVLKILRKHDRRGSFTTYKPSMLKRRIQRRMGLKGFDDVVAYQRQLETDSNERRRLGQDFLISVTDFFREPDTYEKLRTNAIQPLLKARAVAESLRVWVPGCATGEEAYSIAMLIAREIEASGKDYDYTVFASDIDRHALDVARTGLYPESIANDLSPRQLRAYFDKVDSHYQVKRFIRERVVFAAQNVIEDPPYSRLDLISCRHLLMYLKAETQQRVLAMFHFALNSDGFLFLGNAETVGEQVDLFETQSKDVRLFRRIGASRHHAAHMPYIDGTGSDLATASRDRDEQTGHAANAEQIARDILLGEHVPAAVLINRRYEILCSYGPTHHYLSLPLGQTSLGLMEMAREDLRRPLRTIVYRAFRNDSPSEMAATAPGAGDDALKIRARPLHSPESARGLALITFERAPRAADPSAGRNLAESDVNQQLADELESTRRDLQSTIQALEAANEDLKGSNEEILSMNEELQSTNEELETSKEELQSLNEELTTVNGELEHKVAELETAHDDLDNLFSGTQVATLFLDRTMCIKRFTPAIKDLLSLIQSDIGRPLADITLKFSDPDLEADADIAMENLSAREKEVQAHDGRWYQRRILPYRTRDNTIDGVVITFADISDLRRAWLASHASEQRLDLAMSAIKGGMWEMRVDANALEPLADSVYLSARLKRLLGFEDDQLANSLDAWQERIVPEDRAAFADVARRQSGESAQGLIYRIRHRDGSVRWFASHGTLIYDEEGSDNGDGEKRGARWIGIDCDITDIKQSDLAARNVETQLHLLANAMPMLIAFIDRERVIRFTNSAYNEWFDVAEDDVVGHRIDQVFDAKSFETIQPCVDKALSGKSITCELQLARRQSDYTLQVNHIPHMVNGEVLGFYALMTNVTNHRRRRVDQLEQQSSLVYVHRMATVGEMATTLAHDLNQPLTSINTYAGTLTRMLHAGKPADETTPLLRKIADQVERASQIINQTRHFVGRQDEGWETIDVNELAQQAIALLEGRARKQNIDIRLAMDSSLPEVSGYAVQIEQVLINLMSNAFDAMEDVDADQRKLWLTTQQPKPACMQVVIADSGRGIATDKIATLFDAFYTTKLDGMGMGLSISRAIVEWHGGQLWVESQPGDGATFYLTLPVAEKSRQADESNSTASGLPR